MVRQPLGVTPARRRGTVAGLALVGALAATAFPLSGSVVTRELDGFATVAVPRRAHLEPPRLVAEHETWVSFRLDRFHPWAIGSDTPYRASLFLALHAPGAPPASYDEALRAATAALNGGGEDWTQLERSARWDVGAGRYTVNLLDEPTWRLGYRDPSRGVSALWQVYQRDWSLADARAALVAMVESVHRQREPDFAELAERPRREAEARERAVAAALAWLAARGFAPLEPGMPVTRDGVTVEYMTVPERRLMIYAPISSPPAGAPAPWVSHGWRRWTGSDWEYVMPGGDYYPMPGTTRLLDRTQRPPGPHHFLIRTIRLDAAPDADHHLAESFEAISRARPPGAHPGGSIP